MHTDPKAKMLSWTRLCKRHKQDHSSSDSLLFDTLFIIDVQALLLDIVMQGIASLHPVTGGVD